MVDLGRKADLGGLEGVVCRERDREEEHAACVWRVALYARSRESGLAVAVMIQKTYRTHDGCLPLEHVVASRASAARRGRVTAEVDQFLYTQ